MDDEMDGAEIGRVTFNFVALAISICYRVLDLRLYRKADDGGVGAQMAVCALH